MEQEKTKRQEPAFLVADIVKRAKDQLGFKTDAQLAEYLGVSRSTLCNWCARNSIDYPLLLARMKQVDYNWLLTGKGSPKPQHRWCDSRLAEGEVELLHHPRSREPLDERSVTLYDISAAANLKTLLDPRPQYVLGKITIPDIPRCDGAIYVSGDSMYPILKSGDIVGYQFIHDPHDIIYGEMYLVSFNLGGNDFLVVKYVKRSELADHLLLVSYNTHHEPMDVPLADIGALAIIKFSIRKNMMM